MSQQLKPETNAAQALGIVDNETQAVVPPVSHATTYIRAEDNSYPSGNVYARADNPTFKPAEALLTKLEQGADAMLFSSGMAAAMAVFKALKPGDHVLIPRVMYWSLRNWICDHLANWGLQIDVVDMSDLAAISAAIRPGITRLIWLETPGNPLWTQSDIAEIAALAKPHNIIVAVDSTIGTPVHTQPLTLGADIVMHSATKYLNGHSDVISGALICKQDDALWQRIRTIRAHEGSVPGPQDASLLLRGMRTLFLRVKHSSASALYLAEQLQQDPRISEVLYPGLPSFSGHDIACKQMQGGFGGMLSIRVKGGEQAAIATAARVKLWKRATSLGGVESLIEHRASVEGEGTPVPTDLLRLSVGIEDPDDLLNDLLQALDGNA